MAQHPHAVRLHARKRLRSLGGWPRMARTHRFVGAAAPAVATIDTDAAFPVRTGLVSFSTRVRIEDNGGVHSGLVFCFGDTNAGCALWIGDQTIGFHAGASGDADGATALFDAGGELPPGWELRLTAAVNAGSGAVRLWGGGVELARARATNNTMAAWAGAGDGSFGSAPAGTAVSDVPVGSAQAPDGFTILEPLSIFVGQAPRHFT